MTSSALNIAVFGAGLIGRKHISVIARHARLAAIVDPAEPARTLAAELDVPWFDAAEAYLDHHRPDGVIVATPNALHVPQGLACLAAGVPVLIEKPIAESLELARQLVAQSAATGVPVLVGHHRRHSPLVQAAKAAIDDGKLGRIISVDAQFWLIKPDDYFDATWRRRPGGGPTLINLIHDLDLLRHFCGDVTEVWAAQSSQARGFEVEDTAAAIVRFDNGALGTVTLSDTISAPWSWEMTAGENPAYPKTSQSCYRIGGTHGALSVPDLQLWHHPEARSWWAPIQADTLEATPLDPVEQQFLHFCEVIATGAKPLVDAQEGARTLAVLEAIKAAAQSGTRQVVAAV